MTWWGKRSQNTIKKKKKKNGVKNIGNKYTKQERNNF